MRLYALVENDQVDFLHFEDLELEKHNGYVRRIEGEQIWYCRANKPTCQRDAEEVADSDLWHLRQAGHDNCGWYLLVPLPNGSEE